MFKYDKIYETSGIVGLLWRFKRGAMYWKSHRCWFAILLSKGGIVSSWAYKVNAWAFKVLITEARGLCSCKHNGLYS